ncbi:mucin-2-like [Liolophura sinensis]|uniref:mucin-2-like n=1 Tax=Liolophura sinensis TaxID=3198878 RepID=UPI00315984CA
MRWCLVDKTIINILDTAEWLSVRPKSVPTPPPQPPPPTPSQFQGLEGRGELTIRLVSFDNDYGLTYDGGCCDNWQARGWGCMQKCDYVMRVVISGLSRANDHVFLFHRPLMYNKNNIIFDDCPWATELSIPFDTWPGQVELSAYFYDYDDHDDTTLLVDWFDTRLRQESISTKFRHMAVIGSRRNYKTRLTFDWAVSCAGLSNCIRDDVRQFLDRIDNQEFHSKDPITSAAAASGEDPPKSMSTKNTESTTTGEEVKIMTNKTMPTRTAPTNGIWGWKRTTSAAVTGRPITGVPEVRPTVTGVTRFKTMTNSPESLNTKTSETTPTTPVTLVSASTKATREITRHPFDKSSTKYQRTKVIQMNSPHHLSTEATRSATKSGSTKIPSKAAVKATRTMPRKTSTAVITQDPILTQDYFPTTPLSSPTISTPVPLNLTTINSNLPSTTGSSPWTKPSTTKGPYRGRKNKNPFNGHPPLPGFNGAARDITPDLDVPRDHMPSFSRNPEIRQPPKRKKYPPRGRPRLPGRKKNSRPKPRQHGRLSKSEQSWGGNVSQPSPDVPKNENSKNLSHWHGYHQIPGLRPHLKDKHKGYRNSSENGTNEDASPPFETEDSPFSKSEQEQNLAMTTAASSSPDFISHSYYDLSSRNGFQSVSAMRRIPTTKSRHDEPRPITEPPQEAFPKLNNKSAERRENLHVPSKKPVDTANGRKSKEHTGSLGGSRRNPFTRPSPKGKHFHVTSGTKRLTPRPREDDRRVFKTSAPIIQPATTVASLSQSEVSTHVHDVTLSNSRVHSTDQLSQGEDTAEPSKMKTTRTHTLGDVTRNTNQHAKDSTRFQATTKRQFSNPESTTVTTTTRFASSNEFTNIGKDTRVTLHDTNDMSDSFHTFNYVSSEGDSRSTVDDEQFFTERDLHMFVTSKDTDKKLKQRTTNGHDGIFSSATTRKPGLKGETRDLPDRRNSIGWFRKTTKRVYPLQNVEESASMASPKKNGQRPGHFFQGTTTRPSRFSTGQKSKNLKPWYRAKDTDHLYDIMKTIKQTQAIATEEISTQPSSTNSKDDAWLTEIQGNTRPATKEIIPGSNRKNVPKFRERFIPKRTTTDGTGVSPSHITATGPYHKNRRTDKSPLDSEVKPTHPWLRTGTRRKRPTFPHVPTRAPSPQLTPKKSDADRKVSASPTNEPWPDSPTPLFTGHDVANKETTVTPLPSMSLPETVGSRETTRVFTSETATSSTRHTLFPKFTKGQISRKTTVKSPYYSKGSRRMFTRPTVSKHDSISEITRTSPSSEDKKYYWKHAMGTSMYPQTTTSRSTNPSLTRTVSSQLTTKRSISNGHYTRGTHTQRTAPWTRPTTRTTSTAKSISDKHGVTTTLMPKTWPRPSMLDNDRPLQTGKKVNTIRTEISHNFPRTSTAQVKTSIFPKRRFKSTYATKEDIKRVDTATESDSKVSVDSKNEVSSTRFDKSSSTGWNASESVPNVETVTSWWWNTPLLNPKINIPTKTEMYGSSRFPKFKTPRWRNIKRINVMPKSSEKSRRPTTTATGTMSKKGFPMSTESSLVTKESDTVDTIAATTTKYTSLNLIDDDSLGAIENWWKQFAPDADSSKEITLAPWTQNTWRRFQPTRMETSDTTETNVPQHSIASSGAPTHSIQTTTIPSFRNNKDKKTTQKIVTRSKTNSTSMPTTKGRAIVTEVSTQGDVELNPITTFPPWKENTRTRQRGQVQVKSVPTTERISTTSTIRQSQFTSTVVRRTPTKTTSKANVPRTRFHTTEFPSTTRKIRTTSPPWTRNTWKRFKPVSPESSPTTIPTSQYPMEEEFALSTIWTSPIATGTTPETTKVQDSLYRTTKEAHSRSPNTQIRTTTTKIPTTENIFDDLKLDPVNEDDYETKSTLEPKEEDDYFETSLFPTSKRTYRDFSTEEGEGLDTQIYPAVASNTKPAEKDSSIEDMLNSQEPSRKWFTTTQPTPDYTSIITSPLAFITENLKDEVKWKGELLDLLATSGTTYFKTSKVTGTTTVSESKVGKDISVEKTTKDIRRVSPTNEDQPSVEISSKATSAANRIGQDESIPTDLPFMTEVPNSTKLITDSEPSIGELADGTILLTTLITPSKTLPKAKSTTMKDRDLVSSTKISSSTASIPIVTASGTSLTSITRVSETSSNFETSPLPSTSTPTTTVLQASLSHIATALHTSSTPITIVSETSSTKASTVLQTSSTSPKPSSTLSPVLNSSVVKMDSTEAPLTDDPTVKPSSLSTMSSTTSSSSFGKSSNGTLNITRKEIIPEKNSSISNAGLLSTLRTPYSTRDPNSIKVTLPDLISLHNGTTSSVRNGGKPDFVLNANPVKKKRPPIKISAVAAGGWPTTTTAKPTDPPTPPPTPKWREILPDLITLVSVKIPVRTTPRAVGRKTISSSKPVSPASPVYQNADHNKRTKSLDFKTVVEKYWPAILGSFIGAVFLTAAILTSVLCKQQRQGG